MRTGVIIIEGKPGAGKSFKGTEELVRQIVQHRRPVYSNLPLRDRPLRRYLTAKAGKDAFLKLWCPLTYEHFRAHVERSVRIDKAFADWRLENERLGNKAHARDAFDRWYEQRNPDDRAIIRGDGANWIPSGAVCILDEVHLWTPQQGTKKDDSLLAYASMHRHQHHLVYLLSQDAMQISLEWRRQCIEVIMVDDASSIKLWGQFSLAKLGLRNKVARYTHYGWEAYQLAKSTNRRQGDPDRIEMRWLPFNSHIFSLYDSYGRTGISRRKQAKLMAEQARAVGVEPAPAKAVVHKKLRPKRVRGRVYRTVRWTTRTAFLLALGAVLGAGLVRQSEPTVSGGAEAQTPDVVQYTPGVVDAIGPDWIRLDGRRYAQGDLIDGQYLLFQLDHSAGYGVLVHRDVGPAWLLVPGRPATSLGSTAEFMASVRSELGRRSASRGSDAAATQARADTSGGASDGAGIRDGAEPTGPGPGA